MPIWAADPGVKDMIEERFFNQLGDRREQAPWPMASPVPLALECSLR